MRGRLSPREVFPIRGRRHETDAAETGPRENRAGMAHANAGDAFGFDTGSVRMTGEIRSTKTEIRIVISIFEFWISEVITNH